MNAQAWRAVCRLEDLPRQGARRWLGGETPIAVFRTADDRVFALDDRCPHKGGPLSQGIVFDDRVACPLHDWTIGLADGRACAPDHGCARTYAVRVIDGVVLIDPAAPGVRHCAGSGT
ncbi:MAG: nitrite reductase small subunit NirD [Burkholderiales bacterium]|nr:nitrite reductase small subunit NirD [Burkholderiales bacterium]OJX04051.1 MAG: nitrite reductase [Burkholderiales bacterium 70-64]